MAHNCGQLELSSQWWSTRLTRLTFLASTALMNSFWLSAFSGSVWFSGGLAIQHSGYKCTMAKKKSKRNKFRPWLFANSSFQITWVATYSCQIMYFAPRRKVCSLLNAYIYRSVPSAWPRRLTACFVHGEILFNWSSMPGSAQHRNHPPTQKEEPCTHFHSGIIEYVLRDFFRPHKMIRKIHGTYPPLRFLNLRHIGNRISPHAISSKCNLGHAVQSIARSD